MAESLTAGVDIGTTSTKTLAYDTDGKIWAERELEYPIYSPDPAWKEQDPYEILRAVEQTLKNVVEDVAKEGKHIGTIGFSAAMHSILAVDENGEPLTQALTWADQRSVHETEKVKAENGQDIFERTGTPIHPMAPLTKIMWFQKHREEIAAKAAKWISVKEFLFHKWFGEYIVDYSIASASGLFNIHKKQWDDRAMALAGITENHLSTPVSTTYQRSDLHHDVCKRLHLQETTTVVIGASDGVLANVGSGALEEGVVACSIGTSGAIRTVIDRPYTDPKGRIFCYALTDELWVIGGPINNGGIALRWMRDKIMPDLKEECRKNGTDPYDVLTEMAESVMPGSDGLLFLPYMTGERAPFWNSDTKGVFFGLTLHHGREQMVRSVMEGVMMQMYAVVVALIEAGINIKEFRANGGFARSELWKQMMADIFESDIVVPDSHQSACFGAAWLAMTATGQKESLDTIHELIPIETRQSPIKDNVTAYRDLKPIFLRLARNLQSEFSAIAEVQRAHAEGKRTLSTEKGEIL